jgi:oxalate---CoA ligase
MGRGPDRMSSGTAVVAATDRPSTPTEEIVARIWAAELGLPSVGLNEDFIDLGSHSLQGVAVVARLEEHFGVSIPVRVLFEEPTVADLAAWIDRHRRDTNGPQVEIIRLQEGSGLRPIFAVPGARGANSRSLFAFAKLARATDPRRPFYAFPGDPPVPATTPDDRWVQAAAASLNAAVRRRQRHGPYLLFGSCVGGIIAWEMARQLEASGETAHLFLVDTQHPRLRSAADARSRAARWMPRWVRTVINRRILTYVGRRLQFELLRVRCRLPWTSLTAEGVMEISREMPRDAKLRLEMTKTYRPEPLVGRARLLANVDWHRSHATLGWDALAGDGPDVAVMRKEHGLWANMREMAAWLRAGLDEVDPQPLSLAEGEGQPSSPDMAGQFSMTAGLAPPGAESPPATIIDALASWAERMPDAPAFIGPDGEVFDYGRLAAEVERLATTLRELGISRDDPIVIVLPDGPALATMILACMTAGIAAPLSWGMTRHEYMEAMSTDAGRVVVLPARQESPARDAATEKGLPLIELAPASPGAVEIFQLVGDPIGPPAPGGHPRADDIALIINSSGTTGRPKRIPLTHRNITTTSADIRRVMEASSSDRCLSLAPMAFSQGLNALLNTVWAGGSLVVLPGFDLARLPDWIATHRPTWFSITPSVLRTIAMDEATRRAIRASPPRFVRASAGAISAAEIASLEERLGTPVLHSYGMSEASFIAGEHFAASVRKPGSAGMPNHELAIVQVDGTPVASGDTGEIIVRGPHVFPGYLGDPDANAAVFPPQGWFRTGDVGRIDEDGFLFVTGRIKEMIKRAGLSISPREIEDVLMSDPAVEEACVFAVPHPDLGEDVAAAVVIRPGVDVSERLLRDRVASRLSPQKVPRTITVVTEIPRTPTGKPMRSELAAAVGSLLARPTSSGISSRVERREEMAVHRSDTNAVKHRESVPR